MTSALRSLLLLVVATLGASYNSCKDILSASPGANDGNYTITILGELVHVYCDMTSNGGGWTMFGNARDTSKNCAADGNGEFTSKDQTSGWRLSDAQIQALQGSSGKIWYSEPGYCTSSAFAARQYTKNRDKCTGELFFEYGDGDNCNTCKFQSKGGSTDSIKKCSNSYEGSYTAGPGYSNHYGLDTYGAGGVFNDGVCGMYFMWCYQHSLFRDHHNRLNIAGAWIYVREGEAPTFIQTPAPTLTPTPVPTPVPTLSSTLAPTSTPTFAPFTVQVRLRGRVVGKEGADKWIQENAAKLSAMKELFGISDLSLFDLQEI